MILIAFAFAAQAASVAMPTKIPPYNCDVAKGQFQKYEMEGNEAQFHLSGRLVVEDLGRAPEKWVPSAGVLFGDEQGRALAGLRFWRVSKKKLAFGMSHPKSGPGNPQQIDTLPADEPIAFEIALEPTGRMDFTVNGHAYATENVTIRPTHPYLVCSGGHFVFDELFSSK